MKHHLLKNYIVATVIYLSTVSALAGGANGGGGHGTLCRNEVKLLDYLQVESQWTDLKLDMGNRRTTVDQALKIVLDRLAKINPNRARLYREKISEMRDKMNFHKSRNTHTNDSSFLFIPEGCKGDLTIGRQMKPQYRGDREFNFDSNLLKKMKDGRHEAGLYLHEAIEWEYLNGGGKTDSTLVRRVAHFNAFISSDKMNDITLKEYISEVLSSQLFKRFDVQHGIPVIMYDGDFKEIEFYSSNRVKNIEAFYDFNGNIMEFPFSGKTIETFRPDEDYDMQDSLSHLSKGECGRDYKTPADFTANDGIPCLFGIKNPANNGLAFDWGTVFLESQNNRNQIGVLMSPGDNKAYLFPASRGDCTAVISIVDIKNSKISCNSSDSACQGDSDSPVVEINLETNEATCVVH